MTYREKWEKDHPGMSWVDDHVCPTDSNGYNIECPGNAIPTCVDCWNQEIPETPAAEFETFPNIVEAVKKLADSALKTRDAITNAAKALTDNATSILDSGDRTEFATGAVRDMREGKGRCDLMPLEVAAEWLKDDVLGCIAQFKVHGTTTFLYGALNYFLDAAGWSYYEACLEVAKHFEEGAKKYGENNWQKGIPVHCYIDSAIRHYFKFMCGMKDEPHDRSFVWNLMCCIWEVDYHKEDSE